MNKTTPILFGAHMSISEGIYKSIERGESIGCTAIQIFTKSNRQWYAKPLDQEDINAFQNAWKKSSIKSIIAHASYLINIGSPNNELAKKSVAALIEELNRCNMLSIPYLVLHPGSHSKTDIESCLQRISDNIDKALEKSDGKTHILLETMAGQGDSVGNTFEQLATIIKHSHHKSKLGVCLDTCHIFAAGYDFRTKEAYNALWNLFDQTIGLEKLHAIHCNDSKTELNSRVDRHTDIGKGKIGLHAFELLFNDHRFAHIPKILETPKESLSDDLRNMKTINALIK
jgi:deoxyribonuclease-4